MKTLLNPLFVLPMFVLAVAACKKEGCRDTLASNYDGTAEKDNGSCLFESKLQFWQDESANNGLLANGSEMLYYYVDDELLGSTTTATFYDTVPDCETEIASQFTINLGTSKAKISTFQVKDETDSVFWSGTINLFAADCKSYQLSL